MNLPVAHPDRYAAAVEAPVAHVDRDLEDLIPGFMENRQEDMGRLRNALDRGDFEALAGIAHTLKGSGGGYGFDEITEISAGMEIAAKARDKTAVEAALAALITYLERVQIVYV